MKKFISEFFLSFRKSHGTAVTSLSLQVGSVGLTFITNLFLARIMLPSNYGAFAYASSLIFVLAGLGTFGTPTLIVKETGAVKDISYIKKLLRWSASRSGIFVLLILAVFIFISLQFHLFFGAEQMREFRTPMLVSLLSIPLLSFLYIPGVSAGKRKNFQRIVQRENSEVGLFSFCIRHLFFCCRKAAPWFQHSRCCKRCIIFRCVFFHFSCGAKTNSRKYHYGCIC